MTLFEWFVVSLLALDLLFLIALIRMVRLMAGTATVHPEQREDGHQG